jgi:hypothetical protein
MSELQIQINERSSPPSDSDTFAPGHVATMIEETFDPHKRVIVQAWVRGPRAHAVGVATDNSLNSLIFSIGQPSKDSKIIDTRVFQ